MNELLIVSYSLFPAQTFTISIAQAIRNTLKFSFKYSQFFLPSLKKVLQSPQIHFDFGNVYLAKKKFQKKHSSVSLQALYFFYLQGCMPIKWTAPEILSGNFAELSTQSDVYVKYELFRLCLS